MDKRTLAVIVGAAIFLVAGIAAAMAFTGGGDSGGPMMTMPDGSTMPADEMPQDGMMTTDGMTGGMMTMGDGSTMPSNEMEDSDP